jgi:hypothetical protein
MRGETIETNFKTSIMKTHSILKPENQIKIQEIFKTEKDYRKMMQALRKTRSGLMHIHAQSPSYKDEIMNQMKAINDLIGALYVNDLPHPWLEESNGDPEDSDSYIPARVRLG